MDIINDDWNQAIGNEFDKLYFKELIKFIDLEYATKNIFPKREDIFNALNYTKLEDVKVLLVGQDPYHNENQAHGLSFSVLPDQQIPKSLVNIYKELKDDMNCKIPNNGYLKKWADQGVLLLNTVLTVEAHQPHSHKNKGWEEFTDAVIKKINEQDRPLVVFLWGKPAQKKKKFLTNKKHLIIEAPHPSPLSSYRGFFGSKCFSKCNAYLEANGIQEIDWQIEDI
jgi:uracil-DNA glycosylase